MRRAAKVDSNHVQIVSALRQAGCGVLSLAAIGKGCPDLLVHFPVFPFTTVLLEVKDGSKPPSARRLTPEQYRFHAEWKGPLYVVTTPQQALDALGVL